MTLTESPIRRRLSRQIMVGSVPVGGNAPIAVQSMTNTETTDVAATVAQIRQLENVGADIVRVSVPSMEAAEAFGLIRQQVNVLGGGSYQTLINHALREYVQRQNEPLEEILRRVVREELERAA